MVTQITIFEQGYKEAENVSEVKRKLLKYSICQN